MKIDNAQLAAFAAVLSEGSYDAWLSVHQDKAREFMRQYAASWLTANPVENKKDKIPKDWRA